MSKANNNDQRSTILSERLVREALTASRFVAVGATATIVHISVAFFALRIMAAGVATSNSVGFAFALLVSYVGHYYLTFRSSKGHSVSAARFIMTASIAYLINIIVVTVLGMATSLEPELRLAVGIATMPAVTFILSRLWVY